MGKDVTLHFLEFAVEEMERYNIGFYESEVDFFVYQTSTVCECLTKLREILEVKCYHPETISLDGGHLTYRSPRKSESNETMVHLFFPRELNDDVQYLVKEIYDDYFRGLPSELNV